MSVSFYIKNPKKLFRRTPVLSVQECFQLSSQPLTQFLFDESDENFDLQEFYAKPLSDFECLLLGVDGKSGRGFELSFDKEMQEYTVREFTPSTIEDWQIALQYLADLAHKLKQPIVCETEETFTANTIKTFDFERDIRFGIAAIPFDEDEISNCNLSGVIRPVSINKDLREQILADNNPSEALSSFIREIQWLDAYSANQIITQKNDTNELFGIYILGPDLPTILPYEPALEYGVAPDISNDEISHWLLVLYLDENTFIELPYPIFIERLPKEKYRFIDASYILLDAFTQDELTRLAAE